MNASMACFHSYPLNNLPLTGNTPIEHRTLKVGYAVPDGSHVPAQDGSYDDQKRPRWVSISGEGGYFDMHCSRQQEVLHLTVV